MIREKLERIVIAELEFCQTALRDAVDCLMAEALRLDEAPSGFGAGVAMLLLLSKVEAASLRVSLAVKSATLLEAIGAVVSTAGLGVVVTPGGVLIGRPALCAAILEVMQAPGELLVIYLPPVDPPQGNALNWWFGLDLVRAFLNAQQAWADTTILLRAHPTSASQPTAITWQNTTPSAALPRRRKRTTRRLNASRNSADGATRWRQPERRGCLTSRQAIPRRTWTTSSANSTATRKTRSAARCGPARPHPEHRAARASQGAPAAHPERARPSALGGTRRHGRRGPWKGGGMMRHKQTGAIVAPTVLRAMIVGFAACDLEAVQPSAAADDSAQIVKDGVAARPYEDPVCFGGKRTRCGCLYHLPGLPELRESYRAADVRWLRWPDSYEAWAQAGRAFTFAKKPHRRADMAEEAPSASEC